MVNITNVHLYNNILNDAIMYYGFFTNINHDIICYFILNKKKQYNIDTIVYIIDLVGY